MIPIQRIALYDAAVRLSRRLRFYVDVFYSAHRVLAGKYFVYLSVLLLLVCGCSSRGEEPVLEPVSEPAMTAERAEPSVQNMVETETVTVHVCGAVRKEGVYVLPSGSRIRDAVEAAGGFSEDADRSWLNLAMQVEDAWQIRVPSREEAENLRKQQGTLSDGSSQTDKSPAEEGAGIDLNTASKEELMKIPGVGEAKAQRIIDYRQQNGRFEAVEELMKVPGIKNASFQKMKEYITVQ